MGMVATKIGNPNDLVLTSTSNKKKSEMINLKSEKEKQEMIYKNSKDNSKNRASNGYMPFNSKTFTEGSMLAPYLREGVAHPVNEWWSKIGKTVSAPNNTWQNKHHVRSKSEQPAAISMYYDNKTEPLESIINPTSLALENTISTVPSNYSNRPMLYYFETLHSSGRTKPRRQTQISPNINNLAQNENLSTKHSHETSSISPLGELKPKEAVSWKPERTPHSPLQYRYSNQNPISMFDNQRVGGQMRDPGLNTEILNIPQPYSQAARQIISPFLVTNNFDKINEVTEKLPVQSPFLMRNANSKASWLLEDILQGKKSIKSFSQSQSKLAKENLISMLDQEKREFW